VRCRSSKPVLNLPRHKTIRNCPWFSATVATLLVLAAVASSAQAIIVLGPQQRNLSAPTGGYSNSGWQYQGLWGKFLGTAIGSHYFITARHVGGLVGDKFLYQGREYETIDVCKFRDCDLAVWTVAQPLPEYASIYVGDNLKNREVVLFGRGTKRGDPVIIDGRLRGWRWGKHDGQRSWGLSRVQEVVPSGGSGDLGTGEKLSFSFEYNGNPNTGSVSSGDSGGGVFIKEGANWKLVGINYGVSGQYSSTGSPDDEFAAAIFDGRGFWQRYAAGYTWTNELERYPATTISYATRIAPYAKEILESVNHPPHRQIFTRRRVTLIATVAFPLLVLAYIYRVRWIFRARRKPLAPG
jgi:hypothetical protein